MALSPGHGSVVHFKTPETLLSNLKYFSMAFNIHDCMSLTEIIFLIEPQLCKAAGNNTGRNTNTEISNVK